MWAFKEGYDYIVVNFGFYHYCKTPAEALAAAQAMKGDKPSVYTNGFHSEKLGKWIGRGTWFHNAPLSDQIPNR